MPTTTNFGWTTPADTDLVKDGASAIRTLGSNIDTSLVDLKGGTTGQILAKASNTDLDFTWSTAGAGFSGCGLTQSSGTTMTNGAETTLTFDTETFDVGGYHSTVTNTDRITIPSGKDGYYLVTGRVTVPQNTTGARIVYLKKNTSTYVGMHSSGAANSDISTTEINQIINLVATDYLTVTFYQNSGTNLTTQNTNFQTNFQVQFLGA